MTRPIFRHWVGRCQYPDRKPFLLGTVQAHSELEALDELAKLWARISPHPLPSHIEAEPGLLAFHPEEEEA